jgi:hypothetical protein
MRRSVSLDDGQAPPGRDEKAPGSGSGETGAVADPSDRVEEEVPIGAAEPASGRGAGIAAAGARAARSIRDGAGATAS